MARFRSKIKKWLGYHNGPINTYTGKGFKQGAGFDVFIDSFEIKRLGIRIVKEVKIHVDPLWFDNLEKRLAELKSINVEGDK